MPTETDTPTLPPETTASPETTVPPTTAAPTDFSDVPTAALPPGILSEPNVAEVQRFLTDGDDGEFYMVNLIKHREQAQYADGRDTDLTGAEADAIYGEFIRTTMFPRIGAEVVYAAEVERDVIGGSSFDVVAVARYPSKSAFMQMTNDPEFQEMSVHKAAGVEETTVLATTLLEIPNAPLLDNPPFPATGDDPAFAFMHVLDYRDTAIYAEGDADADNTRSGEDAVNTYSANAGTVAAPLGIRPAAWFNVEATVIGPPGVWEEVRINTFPSHATFSELTSNPIWGSGSHHRTAGIAHTYAIMSLPQINEFNGVLANTTG